MTEGMDPPAEIVDRVAAKFVPEEAAEILEYLTPETLLELSEQATRTAPSDNQFEVTAEWRRLVVERLNEIRRRRRQV